MILFFAAAAFILIWSGFETSTNGHHRFGAMLAICGVFALATGAGLDVYINHLNHAYLSIKEP